MVKQWLAILCVALMLPWQAFAVELDVDANSAIDVSKGGTNATTTSGARTALGLGTAATANTGTGATNVILGNDARLTDPRAPLVHNQGAETITSGTLDGDRLPAPGAKKGGVTSADMAAKRDASAQASTDAAQDLAFANHTSSLGPAAYADFGTGSGDAMVGNDARVVGALQPGAPATSIANTPAGSIAATDVDAALRELDTEKATAAQGAKADSALQGDSLFKMCNKPPYNADNTGATFTTAALQSCISAAMTSGGVAWISGTYKTDANIWINTGSGVIDGTGTIDARASSGDGILLLGSNTDTAPKGTAIKNITVRGAATGKHNINIHGAPYTYLPENITVENVKTLDTVETGIFANGVKGFKALYNYNDGGRRAISVMSPLTNHDLLDDVLLLGNKTKNTTWFGYQTYYGKNVQLLANECDGSLLSGGDNSCITTDRTNNVTAALNILKNSPVRAMLIQGGDNISVTGNPISNSPEGIKVTGNGEYVEDADAKEIHGLTIANNPMTNVGNVVIGNGVIGGNISGNTCISDDPLKCGMSFEAFTRGDSYVMPLTSMDVTGNKISGVIKNASAYTITASNNGSATYNNTGSGDIVVDGGGGGSVTSVTSANADIAVATTTTTPALTLNSGTGANQIVKLTSDGKLPAVDGSLLTGITAGATPAGAVTGAIQGRNATGNGFVADDTVVVDSTNHRLGVGTATPSTTLHIFGKMTIFQNNSSATEQGVLLSGTGTTFASPSTADGALIQLGYNGTNNKQLLFKDSANIDSAIYGDIRCGLGNKIPTIDARSSDSTTAFPIGLGGTASKVAIGFATSADHSTVQARLHVKNTTAAEPAEILQGAASQTANLTEWRNSSATVLSSVNPAGEFLESVQATVTDANLTATAAYSKLTVTSTTQRTVTLPAVANIGMTTKLVEVCGTAVVPNVAWAAGAGSVTWGDTGAPTFTSGKCQYITAITTNTAATSTAAWRLMTDGRTW